MAVQVVSAIEGYYQTNPSVSSQEYFGKACEAAIRTCLILPWVPASTDVFDIETAIELFSIKSIEKGNAVYFGDALRMFANYGNITDPRGITVVVCEYTKNNRIKTVEKIYEFCIGRPGFPSKWLFGDVESSVVKELDLFVKAIPANIPIEELTEQRNFAKTRAKQINKLSLESGGHFQINCKIDSKKQRRVQCSIPSSVFKSFIESPPVNFDFNIRVHSQTVIGGQKSLIYRNSLFVINEKIHTNECFSPPRGSTVAD